MDIGVRYAIVVQTEELDEEAFVDEISKKYGDVVDRADQMLDEETQVRIFYLEASFSQYFKCKLELNCIEPERYVLFPMKSYYDKMEVLIKEMAD